MPCGGFLFPTYNPSTAGVAAVTETSLETTKISRGGGGGDSHDYEQYLLSFAGSELSCNLHHVRANRAEAMEGLIALLYNRGDVRFFSPNLGKIFIALGPGCRLWRRRGRSTRSVKYKYDLNRNLSYSILLFILCRM